jgi:hypothetical protein
MTAVLFPLLGIIFAFVVAASCAMSHGEVWSPGYSVGVLMLAAIIGAAFARADQAAWLF